MTLEGEPPRLDVQHAIGKGGVQLSRAQLF